MFFFNVEIQERGKEKDVTWKTLSKHPRWAIFFYFCSTRDPLICLPPHPQTSDPCPVSSPGPSATADLGVGQKPTIRARCRPPFLRSRSTVNCVLCPAMQMWLDQSRRDGTTPMRGPLPKTNRGSLQWPGVSVVFLFFQWETPKNHERVIFLPLGRPLGLPAFLSHRAATRYSSPSACRIHSLIGLSFRSLFLDRSMPNRLPMFYVVIYLLIYALLFWGFLCLGVRRSSSNFLSLPGFRNMWSHLLIV